MLFDLLRSCSGHLKHAPATTPAAGHHSVVDVQRAAELYARQRRTSTGEGRGRRAVWSGVGRYGCRGLADNQQRVLLRVGDRTYQLS
jgi:hypothetical protein